MTEESFAQQLSSCKCCVVQALNATSESHLGSEALLATGLALSGNWDFSPCSSSLLPSHRAQAAAPRCLTPVLLLAVLGVWGNQGLWGTAR